MSTLKVDGIRSNSASSDAITLASDGTCTANITNRSNRNLVINGAMQVAQRGTSSTTSGYGSVDRFAVYYTGTDEAPTHAQGDVASGTSPYIRGFKKTLKITNGNQTSGAGSGDYIFARTILEAQDIASSGWRYMYSNQYITLSFWVKSSVAQNFHGYLRSLDGTAQLYPFETGSLSADTWTKITKTIIGNSNITLDNNSEGGLEIVVAPFWGTDYTGSVSLNAWAAFSNSTRTPDNTTTWYTTNDATFEITGVQLEVGSVATDFEHRSYAQELALCQRYFYRWNPGGTSSEAYFLYAGGYTSHSTSAFFEHTYAPPMRATPTATTPSVNSQSGGSWSLYSTRARWICSATDAGSGAVFTSQIDFSAEL